ncbi:TPA: hypothetical protein EYP66_12505 [Candidatus Poribacteria bacterium]|nr:hypothetical protein [Candidatus Poribacteria bacterium]
MNNQITRRELGRLKERMTALETELARLKADVARIETRLDTEEAAAVVPPPETISPEVTHSAGVPGRSADSKRCYQEVLQKLEQLGYNLVKDEKTRSIYHINHYSLMLRFSKPFPKKNTVVFFFNVTEKQFAQMKNSFIFFCCGDAENCLIIPDRVLLIHHDRLSKDKYGNYKFHITQDVDEWFIDATQGVRIEVTEYLNNYDQLHSPPFGSGKWESGVSQLPVETFHAGLKWLLEQGEYDKILKLKGKIPEDMAIKGIFLVAKRHVDAALLE